MIDKDTIIKLARDSGFNLEQGFLLRVTGIDEDLERFAQSIYKLGLEDAANLVQASAQMCATGGYGYTILSSNATAIRKLGERHD